MPQKVMLNSPTGGAVKTKVVSAAIQKSFDDSGSKVQRYSGQTKTPGIGIQTVSIATGKFLFKKIMSQKRIDKIVKKFQKAAAQKVYSKDSKEATTEASSVNLKLIIFLIPIRMTHLLRRKRSLISR